MSKIDEEYNDPDTRILGGSHTDRAIGMLLERTEAVRELHEAMRREFKDLVITNANVNTMMKTIMDRLEAHERADTAAFAGINRSFDALVTKIDTLSADMRSANMSSRIQKAQFDTGWKVIVVVGGIVAACFAIFAIFYNHH
jgi:hypothetical protein